MFRSGPHYKDFSNSKQLLFVRTSGNMAMCWHTLENSRSTTAESNSLTVELYLQHGKQVGTLRTASWLASLRCRPRVISLSRQIDTRLGFRKTAASKPLVGQGRMDRALTGIFLNGPCRHLVNSAFAQFQPRPPASTSSLGRPAQQLQSSPLLQKAALRTYKLLPSWGPACAPLIPNSRSLSSQQAQHFAGGKT